MKSKWLQFYDKFGKEESGFRRKYASRYVPSDGINPRYKVVDVDFGNVYVVDNYTVASKLFCETLSLKHQAQMYEF